MLCKLHYTLPLQREFGPPVETEIACSVAYLVQLGIGVEDIIENFILKSSEVRFKSHGVRELKNLR